jgi:uncharacterized membrane protein
MPSDKDKPPRARTGTPRQTSQAPHPAPGARTQSPAPQTQQQLAQVTYQEQTTGYLVPPSMLERYEAILPGFSERWLSMAERQEAHRQQLERHTVIGDGRRAWAGIMSALIICLATIAAAAAIALGRHDVGATILSALFGASGLVGVAGVFVYGTRSRRQERIEKARIMTGQG